MTFKNQLISIENDLNDLQNEELVKQKTKTFTDNIIKLEQVNASFEKIVKQKSLFDKKNIEISVDTEKLNLIKDNLSKVNENFKANQTEQTLTQGRFLGNYFKFCEEFEKSFDDLLKISWKKYCGSKYNRENFSTLNSSVIKTPENKKTLELFLNEYSNFSKLLQNPSFEENEFEEIDKIAVELNKLRSDIKENYHEDVKRFLDEINSKGFATIDILTEEVIRFISTHELKNEYVIRRNSNEFQ